MPRASSYLHRYSMSFFNKNKNSSTEDKEFISKWIILNQNKEEELIKDNQYKFITGLFGLGTENVNILRYKLYSEYEGEEDSTRAPF